MDILLAVVIGFITFVLFMPGKSKSSTFCKLHAWEYKDQPGDEKTQYLQCSICNFLPGHDDGTEK